MVGWDPHVLKCYVIGSSVAAVCFFPDSLGFLQRCSPVVRSVATNLVCFWSVGISCMSGWLGAAYPNSA